MYTLYFEVNFMLTILFKKIIIIGWNLRGILASYLYSLLFIFDSIIETRDLNLRLLATFCWEENASTTSGIKG